MKTLEQCQWRRSSAFILNCEHISNFVLLVTLKRQMFAEIIKIKNVMRYVAVF